MTTLYNIPSVFSPNWFEQVTKVLTKDHETTNSRLAEDSSIYYVDSGYPYNIYVKQDAKNDIEEYVIEMALAGIGKDNISVRVREGKLHISVQKTDDLQDAIDKVKQKKVDDLQDAIDKVKAQVYLDSEKKYTKKVYKRKGLTNRSCSVAFTLGKDVDPKGIKSTYVDGLLTVSIPCLQPETQNIDISVD